MTNKFHLKEDGTVAKCEAEIRACPVAGPINHFDSEAKARAAFELSMGSSLPPTLEKSYSIMPPKEPTPVGWENLDEADANQVANLDTLVRDWYFEARTAGGALVDHDSAYRLVQAFDSITHRDLDLFDIFQSDTYQDELTLRGAKNNYDKMVMFVRDRASGVYGEFYTTKELNQLQDAIARHPAGKQKR